MLRETVDIDTYRKAFGARLRFLRKLENLTQEQLAERADLSYEHINKLERGVGGPSFAVICTLAEALNIDPAGLFFFSKPATPPEEASTEESRHEPLPTPSDGFGFVSQMGMWEYDPHIQAFSIDDSLLTLLDIKRDDIPLHISLADFFSARLHPDDRDSFLQAVQALPDESLLHNLKFRLQRNAGEYGIYICGCRTRRDDEGNPLLICGSLLDITDLKHLEAFLLDNRITLEDRIKQQTEKLEQAVENLTQQIEEKEATQRSLKRSERKFRNYFQHIPLQTCIYQYSDGLFYLIEANAEAEKYSQGTISSFIGKSASEIFNDFPAAVDDMKLCYENQETINNEWSFTSRVRDVSVCFAAHLVFIEPDMVAVHVEEVTERKAAENALRQSEQRYRTLFENAPLGMFTSLLEGIFLDVNQSLAEMLGFDSPQETIDGIKNIADDVYVKPPHRDTVVESVQETNGILKFVNMYRRRNGETFYGKLHLARMYDEERELHYLLGMVEDITERKNAELLLQESEEKYRTVADFTYDWEYWISPEGRYIYMSPSCERITGYTPQEFLEDPDLLRRIMHPDDAFLYENHFQPEPLKEPVQAYDFRIIDRSGAVRWIAHICRPVYTQQGKWSGRRASNRDITEQKRLTELKEEVERILRHDMKSPLISILSGIRLLSSEPNLSPQSLEILHALEDSANAVLAKLKLTVDINRMESGTYTLKPIPTNIIPLVFDIVRETMHLDQENCSDKIAIFLDGAEACSSDMYTMNVEKTLFRSLLYNLILNALEADKGREGVTISLSMDEDNHILTIHNAQSVPQEIRAVFFDKYTTAGKSFGTGLGTYAAKLITERHNGIIEMATDDATGTTITLTFPKSIEVTRE